MSIMLRYSLRLRTAVLIAMHCSICRDEINVVPSNPLVSTAGLESTLQLFLKASARALIAGLTFYQKITAFWVQ